LNEPSVVLSKKPRARSWGSGSRRNECWAHADGILAVRPLKDGVIADFDVTEKMLRFFLKTIIGSPSLPREAEGGRLRAVGHHRVEKRAVRDSAQSAGAKEVYMVAEPMAAAIGVGLPVETPTATW